MTVAAQQSYYHMTAANAAATHQNQHQLPNQLNINITSGSGPSTPGSNYTNFGASEVS